MFQVKLSNTMELINAVKPAPMVCRLCNSCDKNTLVDLSSQKIFYAAEYRRVIQIMTGVMIDPGDNLPSTVCRVCIKRALEGYDYRKSAQLRNQQYMLKHGRWQGPAAKKPKQEDDDDVEFVSISYDITSQNKSDPISKEELVVTPAGTPAPNIAVVPSKVTKEVAPAVVEKVTPPVCSVAPLRQPNLVKLRQQDENVEQNAAKPPQTGSLKFKINLKTATCVPSGTSSEPPKSSTSSKPATCVPSGMRSEPPKSSTSCKPATCVPSGAKSEPPKNSTSSKPATCVPSGTGSEPSKSSTSCKLATCVPSGKKSEPPKSYTNCKPATGVSNESKSDSPKGSSSPSGSDVTHSSVTFKMLIQKGKDTDSTKSTSKKLVKTPSETPKLHASVRKIQEAFPDLKLPEGISQLNMMPTIRLTHVKVLRHIAKVHRRSRRQKTHFKPISPPKEVNRRLDVPETMPNTGMERKQLLLSSLGLLRVAPPSPVKTRVMNPTILEPQQYSLTSPTSNNISNSIIDMSQVSLKPSKHMDAVSTNINDSISSAGNVENQDTIIDFVPLAENVTPVKEADVSSKSCEARTPLGKFIPPNDLEYSALHVDDDFEIKIEETTVNIDIDPIETSFHEIVDTTSHEFIDTTSQVIVDATIHEVDDPKESEQSKFDFSSLEPEDDQDSVTDFECSLLQIVKKQDVFVCKECNKVYLRSSLLRRHEINHQKCRFCNKFFDSISLAKKHVREVHVGPKEAVVKILKMECDKKVAHLLPLSYIKAVERVHRMTSRKRVLSEGSEGEEDNTDKTPIAEVEIPSSKKPKITGPCDMLTQRNDIFEPTSPKKSQSTTSEDTSIRDNVLKEGRATATPPVIPRSATTSSGGAELQQANKELNKITALHPDLQKSISVVIGTGMEQQGNVKFLNNASTSEILSAKTKKEESLDKLKKSHLARTIESKPEMQPVTKKRESPAELKTIPFSKTITNKSEKQPELQSAQLKRQESLDKLKNLNSSKKVENTSGMQSELQSSKMKKQELLDKSKNLNSSKTVENISRLQHEVQSSKTKNQESFDKSKNLNYSKTIENISELQHELQVSKTKTQELHGDLKKVSNLSTVIGTNGKIKAELQSPNTKQQESHCKLMNVSDLRMVVGNNFKMEPELKLPKTKKPESPCELIKVSNVRTVVENNFKIQPELQSPKTKKQESPCESIKVSNVRTVVESNLKVQPELQSLKTKKQESSGELMKISNSKTVQDNSGKHAELKSSKTKTQELSSDLQKVQKTVVGSNVKMQPELESLKTKKQDSPSELKNVSNLKTVVGNNSKIQPELQSSKTKKQETSGELMKVTNVRTVVESNFRVQPEKQLLQKKNQESAVNSGTVTFSKMSNNKSEMKPALQSPQTKKQESSGELKKISNSKTVEDNSGKKPELQSLKMKKPESLAELKKSTSPNTIKNKYDIQPKSQSLKPLDKSKILSPSPMIGNKSEKQSELQTLKPKKQESGEIKKISNSKKVEDNSKKQSELESLKMKMPESPAELKKSTSPNTIKNKSDIQPKSQSLKPLDKSKILSPSPMIGNKTEKQSELQTLKPKKQESGEIKKISNSKTVEDNSKKQSELESLKMKMPESPDLKKLTSPKTITSKSDVQPKLQSPKLHDKSKSPSPIIGNKSEMQSELQTFKPHKQESFDKFLSLYFSKKIGYTPKVKPVVKPPITITQKLPADFKNVSNLRMVIDSNSKMQPEMQLLQKKNQDSPASSRPETQAGLQSPINQKKPAFVHNLKKLSSPKMVANKASQTNNTKSFGELKKVSSVRSKMQPKLTSSTQTVSVDAKACTPIDVDNIAIQTDVNDSQIGDESPDSIIFSDFEVPSPDNEITIEDSDCIVKGAICLTSGDLWKRKLKEAEYVRSLLRGSNLEQGWKPKQVDQSTMVGPNDLIVLAPADQGKIMIQNLTYYLNTYNKISVQLVNAGKKVKAFISRFTKPPVKKRFDFCPVPPISFIPPPRKYPRNKAKSQLTKFETKKPSTSVSEAEEVGNVIVVTRVTAQPIGQTKEPPIVINHLQALAPNSVTTQKELMNKFGDKQSAGETTDSKENESQNEKVVTSQVETTVNKTKDADNEKSNPLLSVKGKCASVPTINPQVFVSAQTSKSVSETTPATSNSKVCATVTACNRTILVVDIESEPKKKEEKKKKSPRLKEVTKDRYLNLKQYEPTSSKKSNLVSKSPLLNAALDIPVSNAASVSVPNNQNKQLEITRIANDSSNDASNKKQTVDIAAIRNSILANFPNVSTIPAHLLKKILPSTGNNNQNLPSPSSPNWNNVPSNLNPNHAANIDYNQQPIILQQSQPQATPSKQPPQQTSFNSAQQPRLLNHSQQQYHQSNPQNIPSSRYYSESSTPANMANTVNQTVINVAYQTNQFNNPIVMYNNSGHIPTQLSQMANCNYGSMQQINQNQPPNQMLQINQNQASNQLFQLNQNQPSNQLIQINQNPQTNQMHQMNQNKSSNQMLQMNQNQPSNQLIQLNQNRPTNQVLQINQHQSPNQILIMNPDHSSNQVQTKQNQPSNQRFIQNAPSTQSTLNKQNPPPILLNSEASQNPEPKTLRVMHPWEINRKKNM